MPNSCDPEPGNVHDELMVTNYILSVEEVSFLGDHPLFKDSALTNPPIIVPITDPVWRRTPAKNEAVAYTRNSPYQMNVLVKSSHVPFHDFQYRIDAITEGNLYNSQGYTRHLAFSQYDTVKAIDPVSWGHFPDHVGVIDSLRFHWMVNKAVAYGEMGFYFINPSGPHKIYLTYDKPKLDTVNTLALEKICRYAQNQNIDTAIAHSGVTGAFNEHWDYAPEKTFIFADPLDVIRLQTGLCADYANLLATYYRSVGIASKPTVIFNSVPLGDTTFLLHWIYTELPTFPHGCVLTDPLPTCDNPVSISYLFNYHAVCRMGVYFCDAAFGLFKPSINYDAWWRYYLYPATLQGPWQDPEPPPVPPIYRDISYLITSQNLYPPLSRGIVINHYHP